MPSSSKGWVMKSNLVFGDCAELRSEKVDPQASQESFYIGLEHIEQQSLSLSGHGFGSDVDSQKQKFYRGDILFGKLRPYFRKVVIAPFDGICSTDIWVVKPKSSIDRNFLFYWMASERFISSSTHASEGGRMPRAKWDWVSKFEVEGRNFEEQVVIGTVLRALDKKIITNNAISKTLEDIAQTIFKSWFIDFDPVRAKMVGEKPAGIDDATAALFPNSMEDSELGLIPKGWNIKVISDFGKVVTGKTPSTKVPEYWGDQIPFVTIPDMHGQILVTSTTRALSKQGAESQKSQNVPAGSTMVTCIATPGLVGYATKNCHTNQQINSVIPSVEYSSKWLFWHLRGLIPTLIRNSGIGTVFANLNKSDFSKIKSITPTMALRNAFNDVVEPIVELLETLNHESQYLRDIRDGLLPRLISGELQIPDEMLAS